MNAEDAIRKILLDAEVEDWKGDCADFAIRYVGLRGLSVERPDCALSVKAVTRCWEGHGVMALNTGMWC